MIMNSFQQKKFQTNCKYIGCNWVWVHRIKIHATILTLEHRIDHCRNQPFQYHVNHLLIKNPRALTGGQTTIQDLPFLHLTTPNYTFVLQYILRRILTMDTFRPLHRKFVQDKNYTLAF